MIKEKSPKLTIKSQVLHMRSLVFVLLAFSFLFFGFVKAVFAATEFVSVVDTGGTGDFISLSQWESTIQSDLTATSTLVFSYSSASGTIPNLATVVGEISGAVATSTFVTSTTTTSQILLTNVVGVFQAGETVYIEGQASSSNYVIISDNGDQAIAVAKCTASTGVADTQAVTINGWTTATSTYIKIWTDPDDPYGRHNGKWDDGKYRLETSATDDSQPSIYIRDEYVRIDGLQIYIVGNNYQYTGGINVNQLNDSNQLYLSNNIIKGRLCGNGSSGIGFYKGNENNYIFNNVLYDFTGTNNNAIYADLWDGGQSFVYNNTAYNNLRGYYAQNAVGVNNIAVNSLDYDFRGAGWLAGSANNLSSDETADDDLDMTNSIVNTTVQFLDAANNDFHLHPNDTAARDAGTTSTSSLIPETYYDIDGTARGAAFDIGADEVPVEFISTICENTSAGGDCANLDYNSLSTWEDKVESNLSTSTTRVFSGSITGTLNENTDVNLCNGATDLNIDGVVVATTSDQILIDGITGTTTPLSVASGTIWSAEACASMANYWTITGTLDQLGASPVAVAKIDGLWANNNSSIQVDDWLTDNDNYIRVYTADLARHDGAFDTGYAIDGQFNIRVNYITVDGIQINESTSTKSYGFLTSFIDYFGTNIVIKNNLIKTTGEAWQAILIQDSDLTDVKILNNIIYSVDNTTASGTSAGIYIHNTPDNVKAYIYNNTVYNCSRNFSNNSSGYVSAKNNIAINGGTYDYNMNGTTQYSDNNISSDSSAPGTTTIKNVTLNQIAFISTSSTSPDLHIQNNSIAKNVGIDLSTDLGTDYGMTVDIDGAARNPDDLGWDIGADEIPAKQYRSAGNTTGNIDNGGAVTVSSTTRIATFSTAQPDNIGVGDVIQYGTPYQLAFITSRSSSTEYSVQAYDTKAPTATTSATFAIYRAHLKLDDWEDQLVTQINTDINDNVDDLVLVNQDLVASNTQMMVAAYASTNGDDVAVNINGWTTGKQNYIKVYTPVYSNEVGITQRHSGKWDDNKYKLTEGSTVLQDHQQYTVIDGLQIQADSFYGLYFYEANSTAKNNIIQSSVTPNNSRWGIRFLGGSSYAYNNTIYGMKTSNNDGYGILGSSASAVDFYYNNTIVNANKCIQSGINGHVAINNIVQSCDTGFTGARVASSSNNISSDETAPGTNSKNSTTVSFVDSTNDDYHLAPTDTTAIDAGTTSPLSLIPETTYDIDGHYRRTWDIGADEASVEFVTTIEEGGTGDFSTLSSWEDGIESDLVATTTAVFLSSGKTGIFQSGEVSGRFFVGQTSSATGTLITMASSSSQILLVGIEGNFVDGEQIADGYGTTTLSDAGNPAIAIAKIDGAWSNPDTSAVTIDGWTTGPRNYVKIYTTDVARHNGTSGGSNYILNPSTNDNGVSINEDYTVIEGLEITHWSGSGYGKSGILINTANSGCSIKNNLLHDNNDTSTAGTGIYHGNGNGGGNIIYNNIIYNISGRGISVDNYSSIPSHIYNNTVENSKTGLLIYGNGHYAKNNISVNNDSTDYLVAGSLLGISNNISSDTTAPGANSKSSTTVKFLDAANNDFHLAPDDTAARDAGTTSASSLIPETYYDIDGTARGAAFDIGADEVPVDFISTICENTSAGGDCAEMDYSVLATWEDKVEANLSSSTTRVFGGSITGVLAENNTLDVYVGGADTGINITVVATTSDQILVDGITGTTTPLNVASGTQFRLSGATANMWTVTGTGDDLGASPIAIAKIDGSWTNPDTTYVEIYNWTTDQDNYIKIYTTDLARHNGKWDSTKYRFERSSANAISPRTKKVILDGLQFKVENGGTSYNANNHIDSEVVYSNNIFWTLNSSSTISYIYVLSDLFQSKKTVKIFNNIFYGAVGSPALNFRAVSVGGGNYYINNNTFYNFGSAITVTAGISYQTTIAKNNIIASTTNPFHGTFDSATTNNATDDASDTPDGAEGSTINGASFSFISTASGTEDFHLASSDTGAKNLGADLSADSYLKVIDDIDGQGRVYQTDIGADETAIPIYRSVGPNNTSALDTGASGYMTIEGLTATFQTALPENVGVGDAIQYDSNNDSSVDSIAFIHKRLSSTQYQVLTASGTPATEVAGDTDWSIFRAYTSLFNAEAGTENTGINASLRNFDIWSGGKDIVAANQVWNIACYADDTDTTAVTVNGWTTGEYNYIKIFTPKDADEVGASQRHSGKWDMSYYNLITSNVAGISVFEEFVYINGLQIYVNSATTFDDSALYIYNLASGWKVYIGNNILKGAGASTYWHMGIEAYNNDSDGNLYAYNNIIYDFKSNVSGAGIYKDSGTGYFYNNTIHNSDRGFLLSGTQYAKNNITQNCEDGYAGAFDASSDFNISDVGASDAPNATFTNDYATVSFIDESNDDFHLAPGSPGIDVGTSSLGSFACAQDDSGCLDYDIDGDLRTQWDIGADEAAVEFISTVMESGGDFSSLSSWEGAIQADLTATSTRVYTTTSTIGVFQALGQTFTGQTSGATGVYVYHSTSSNQILLESISGTFQSGEIISDGNATTTLVNSGNEAIAVAEIDGAWTAADTNGVSIDGWTTGEYNYVKVYTTRSARHRGKWDDGRYRLSSAVLSDDIGIFESHVEIDGLQITQNNYGSGIEAQANNGYLKIKNNIIKSGVHGYYGIALNFGWGEGLDTYITNNIIYDFNNVMNSSGIWIYDNSFNVYAYNNTIQNCRYGIRKHYPGGLVVLNNNIIQNSLTQDFYLPDAISASSSNNISSDSTAPGSNSKTNTTVAFADAPNDDFHLALTDTAARNAGTSSVATSGSEKSRVYLDIDGNSRGGAIDIGADEAATEFVSTICENVSAGGACAGMDYSSLSTWESNVNSDLTASSTLVYAGSITGALSNGDSVTLYRSGSSQSITGTVTATTSSQILLENVKTPGVYIDTGCLGCRTAQSGDQWRVDASNYWTVTGSGDQLGAPVIATAKIDGAWSGADTALVAIDGWETGPGNYIKIYTTDTARHDGKWNSSKYRLEIIGTSAAVNSNEDFVKLDGLQINAKGSAGFSNSGIKINMSVSGESTVSNNIIKYTGPTSGGDDGGQTGIWNYVDGALSVYNNIVYGFNTQTQPSYGIHGRWNTTYAYNNSVYNNNTCFKTETTSFVSKNNLAQNCTDGFNGTFAVGSDFNISDIAGDAPGSNSKNGVEVTFVSTSTEDFHLSSADTAARNSGVNLSNDANLSFNTDIDGETRYSVWDIGADQSTAAQEQVVGFGQNAEQDDLSSGLVGHWTFNEGIGSAVYDKSGNGNDGTWAGSGGHWTGFGRYGNGGSFNGSDDLVNCGSKSSLDNLTSFSWSFWAKAAGDHGNNYGRVLVKGTGSNQKKYFGFAENGGSDDQKVSFHIDTSAGIVSSVSNTNEYDYNKWYHWTVVYDDSGDRLIRIFKNGNEISYNSQTAATSTLDDDSAQNFYINNDFYNFNGAIDEVRVYNRVLTQREINLLYNEGRAAVEWHFKNNFNDTGTLCELGACKNLTEGGSGSLFTSGYLEEGATALSLGGAAYASLADDAYFDIGSTSDFSLTATIKTSDTGSTTIISKRNSSAAADAGWMFGLDYGHGDGIPYFEASDGSNKFSVYAGSGISDNSWHTVSVVFDESSSAGSRIYIDGSDSTGGTSGTLGSLGSLSNAIALNIGREGGGGGLFTGAFDRIAFYPYALTRGDALRENTSGFNARIGHATSTPSTGSNWDPFGGNPPVAWWKLDEMSGGTAKDYASSSLDGTWYGSGVHHANGKIGMGGRFNGSDDYWQTNSNLFSDISAYTMSFWMKHSGNFGYIFFGGRPYISVYQDGIMRFRANNTNLDSSSINANEWHHITVLNDGSLSQIYIDGRYNIEGADTFSSGTENTFGRDGTSGFNYYSGLLDDIKLYNYIRTPAQIAWDYNRGAPVAHWKFDEASSGSADGATLIDSSGNGYHGTGSSTGSGLTYTAGVFGNSLEFDGINDHITIGQDVFADYSQYSVSLWMKRKSGTSGYIFSGSSFPYLWDFGDSMDHIRFKSNTANFDYPIADNTWKHLVLTSNGSVSSIYVDGIFATSTNDTIGANNSMFIGTNAVFANFFNGYLDDFKIYNYVRTPDQIKEDYNGGRVRFSN